MADITLKLVWYRLGETASNLVERYERLLEWYGAFSWQRVDILDMLFLGWLLAAFLVVGCINIYLRFFRGRKDQISGIGGLGFANTGETCQWINSAISWLFLHYDKTPAFIDCWVRALNEHVKKHNGDVQLKFDRIQAGSLPPKFTQISTQQSPKDTLTLCVAVESTDISLLVSSLQQQPAGSMKAYNCDVIIQRLFGQLQVISQYGADSINVQASFPTPPDLTLQVRQRSFDSHIDPRRLEAVVREAIAGAVTMLAVSPQLNVLNSMYASQTGAPLTHNSPTQVKKSNSMQTPRSQVATDIKRFHSTTGIGNGSSHMHDVQPLPKLQPSEGKEPYQIRRTEHKQVANKKPSHDLKIEPKAEPKIEPKAEPKIEPKAEPKIESKAEPKFETSKSSVINKGLSNGNKMSAMSLKNKRLLVKVIKATGLGEKEAGRSLRHRRYQGSTDAYCVVHMNEPVQKHTTSVAKGTNNPFWDEHFLFDLEDHSQQLRFEVFDREKPPGSDYIGHATTLMSDLRRTPSSRQVIPLTNPKSSNTRASITVEFLFMDPAESQHMSLNTPRNNNMLSDTSPRRRIDTNRTITPGGTTITTTTTTTERRNPSPRESAYGTDSPHRVEKTDTSYNSAEYSPYGTNRNSATGGTANGGENVAETARRELSEKSHLQRTPTKSTTLTITGVTRNYYNTPVIQTTDSSMLEDQPQYSPSMVSTDSYETRRDMKKSKSFASAIKKRFTRGPRKPRSHSADRASSLRGEPRHLLKPPTDDVNKTTDDIDGPGTIFVSITNPDDLENTDIPDGSIRKSRSHSFSSSMKKLFSKKKKGQQSRESSVSRMSTHRYGDTSRDISTAQASPDIAYRDTPGMPLSHPGHGGDYNTRGEYGMYSSSVPPQQSPLYDH